MSFDIVSPLGSHALLVFVLDVGVLLLLAGFLGSVATRFGLPPVVGELLTGVVLGPSLLTHLAPGLAHWLFPHDEVQLHLLDAVGQVGVLLLVGLTGLQIDLALLRRRGVTALRISSCGIVVPLAFGVGLGLLLPVALVVPSAHRVTFALFLGVAMGVSAIPVIAKTLMEMGLLHRNVGQLTLCAVSMDDIVGWILLSVVSGLAAAGTSASSVLRSIGLVLLLLAAAACAVPALRRVLPGVLRFGERGGGGQGRKIMIVVSTVLLVAAAAQSMQLEAVFGAFLAGLALNASKTIDVRDLAALRSVVLSVLTPIFFATAGLRMDLTALGKSVTLLAGFAVLAAAIVGKFAGAYAGARLSRLNRYEALAIGAGMNARGVIEIVVAMVGVRLGILTGDMYTIIVLVAIVTSVMAPPILRVSMRRVQFTAEERLRREGIEGPPVTSPMSAGDRLDPA